MSEVSQKIDPRGYLIKHLDAGERIQAHLLVIEEARRVKSTFTDDTFPTIGPVDYPSIRTRLQKYAEFTSPLLELVAIGCFSGSKEMAVTWADIIELISEYPQVLHQDVINLRRLRAYPTLILAYGGGVSAIAGGNYGTLATILYRTWIASARTKEVKALAQSLYPEEIMDSQFVPHLFAEEPSPQDMHGHLQRVIRPALIDILPSDRKFTEAFDRFEAFLALAYADLSYTGEDREVGWVPAGNFHRRRDDQVSVWERMKWEADTDEENWAPLQAGLFHGSVEYYRGLKGRVDQFLSRTGVW